MFLLRRFCVVLVFLLFAASSICHSALPWTDYAERVEAPGLEARQVPGVVSAQDFLRRAWHTCQFSTLPHGRTRLRRPVKLITK